MAVFFRNFNPPVGDALAPDGTTAFLQVFSSAGSPVTLEVWPAGAATIAAANVYINGIAINSNLAPIGGCAGQTLTFQLGGNNLENAEAMNVVTIGVTTANPATVSSVDVNYYRRANPMMPPGPLGKKKPPGKKGKSKGKK